MRLEPDRLPLLRPFEEDERDFAVVRLRPPDEPFDEPLLRLDEDLGRELEPDDFELEPEDRDFELEPEDPDFELEPDDRDRLDAELRLRELDDERCFFTLPSSILPRQAPSSSSFIIT